MPASRHSAIRSAPTKPGVSAGELRQDRRARRVQRHFARMNLENLLAPRRAGRADIQLVVEAARPAQGDVQRFDAVGGGQDHHAVHLVQPVHERQQLRDQARVGVRAALPALGGDHVELVDEDHRGRMVHGLAEDAAQVALALAVARADDLRTVDVIELRLHLVGRRAREQRLAGARRPVENHPAHRRDADLAIDARETAAAVAPVPSPSRSRDRGRPARRR